MAVVTIEVVLIVVAAEVLELMLLKKKHIMFLLVFFQFTLFNSRWRHPHYRCSKELVVPSFKTSNVITK